jgi:hypothetical protein
VAWGKVRKQDFQSVGGGSFSVYGVSAGIASYAIASDSCTIGLPERLAGLRRDR